MMSVLLLMGQAAGGQMSGVPIPYSLRMDGWVTIVLLVCFCFSSWVLCSKAVISYFIGSVQTFLRSLRAVMSAFCCCWSGRLACWPAFISSIVSAEYSRFWQGTSLRGNRWEFICLSVWAMCLSNGCFTPS